jgi:hypothetical protein
MCAKRSTSGEHISSKHAPLRSFGATTPELPRQMFGAVLAYALHSATNIQAAMHVCDLRHGAGPRTGSTELRGTAHFFNKLALGLDNAYWRVEY